ncbi:MAG TPA: metalloregulator ArsR/SmtB family transcription factor [Thermodesulfovibrionales bacterium]|jgi:ArsR family transcriptional regulator|nr:metalloregulator ArsR/SmtB family transcription factor [Thermodesulfovibrionales bacterium]
MKDIAKLCGVFSDETRMRILMLLTRKEMCVCQIMGVLGISQPLVSRNLFLLRSAGLLSERREGKLVFYSLIKDLPAVAGGIISLLKKHLKDDPVFTSDLQSLADCSAFQKRSGKCDMKTFLAFIEEQRKKRQRSVRK